MFSFTIIQTIDGTPYTFRTDDWHTAIKLHRPAFARQWAAEKQAAGDTEAFEPFRPVWFESEIVQFSALFAAHGKRVA